MKKQIQNKDSGYWYTIRILSSKLKVKQVKVNSQTNLKYLNLEG